MQCASELYMNSFLILNATQKVGTVIIPNLEMKKFWGQKKTQLSQSQMLRAGEASM